MVGVGVGVWDGGMGWGVGDGLMGSAGMPASPGRLDVKYSCPGILGTVAAEAEPLVP